MLRWEDGGTRGRGRGQRTVGCQAMKKMLQKDRKAGASDTLVARLLLADVCLVGGVRDRDGPSK